MIQKHPVLQGTLILTVTSILARILGFYNRIFLSRVIGAKELGIFQMIFPVYLFCFAVSCQGFQVGLSKMVAGEKANFHIGNVQFLIHLTLQLCLFLSILLSIFLFCFSDYLSIHLFCTPSVADCLKIAALSLPFVSIKSVLLGYSIGCGNSWLAGSSQILEQIFRVGSIIFIASTMLYVSCTGAKLAVTGMLIGEISSCIFVILFILRHRPPKKGPESSRLQLYREFFSLSIPISGNRIALTLLQSIEAWMIPRQMMLYYCDHSLSLELYGILTGISLPFLFFPSTMTNALSTMLLPSISADCKQDNVSHRNRSIHLATWGGFLMGLFFTGVFFLFGPYLGNVIFHNSTAGEYIRILSFLCPALYLSSIYISILNGMGLSKKTFFHNMFSICIRLLFIYFAIPQFGIDGYIWGILSSSFLLVICNHFSVQRQMQ